MNKKFTLKMFIIFLKKEGVYEQYLINSYKYFLNKDKIIKEIIECINNGPQYLLHTFCWQLTKEGGDFWCSINEKWRAKILTSHKIKRT